MSCTVRATDKHRMCYEQCYSLLFRFLVVDKFEDRCNKRVYLKKKMISQSFGYDSVA